MDSASTLPLIRQLRPIFAELQTSTRETLPFIIPKIEYILDEEKDVLFHRNLPRTPHENVRVFPKWLNQQLGNLFSNPATYVAGVQVLRALLNVEYIDLNEKTKFFSTLLMRCIFEAPCYEDSVMAAEVWGLMLNNGSSVVEGIIENSLIYSIQLLKDDGHSTSFLLTGAASNIMRAGQTSPSLKHSTSFGALLFSDGHVGRLIGSAGGHSISYDESIPGSAADDNNNRTAAHGVYSHGDGGHSTDPGTRSHAHAASPSAYSHAARRDDAVVDGAATTYGQRSGASNSNNNKSQSEQSGGMHTNGDSCSYRDCHGQHINRTDHDELRYRRCNSARVSKLSGCIIIQQLVRRMPSSVVPHLDRILDGLQRAVIDANDKVRLCAVDALYHILRIAYRSVDPALYQAWQDTLMSNCVRALSFDDHCVLHGCLMTFNALLSSVTSTEGQSVGAGGGSHHAYANRGRAALTASSAPVSTAAPEPAGVTPLPSSSGATTTAAAASALGGWTVAGKGAFSATSSAHIDHTILDYIQANLLPGRPPPDTPRDYLQRDSSTGKERPSQTPSSCAQDHVPVPRTQGPGDGAASPYYSVPRNNGGGEAARVVGQDDASPSRAPPARRGWGRRSVFTARLTAVMRRRLRPFRPAATPARRRRPMLRLSSAAAPPPPRVVVLVAMTPCTCSSVKPFSIRCPCLPATTPSRSSEPLYLSSIVCCTACCTRRVRVVVVPPVAAVFICTSGRFSFSSWLASCPSCPSCSRCTWRR